ncbi:MAG: signal peptidase II [Magnetococcales bacterium]|nr:signal peptidase II [Magnetococcales bacterium]
MRERSMLYWGLGTGAVVLLLDQWTKAFFSQLLWHSGITLIPGFLNLDLVHNQGAAFGMFRSLEPMWRDGILVLVAVVAVVLIVAMLRKTPDLFSALALGLVLGGAIGNLVDRLRFGWVVDFIHVHWYELSWPVFNVADSGITVGIGMLIWQSFFFNKDGSR